MNQPKKRTVDGLLMDMHTAAAFIGVTRKALERDVERRLIPFRRKGRRILFLRDELLEFYTELPGCDLETARENREARYGEEKSVIRPSKKRRPAAATICAPLDVESSASAEKALRIKGKLDGEKWAL